MKGLGAHHRLRGSVPEREAEGVALHPRHRLCPGRGLFEHAEGEVAAGDHVGVELGPEPRCEDPGAAAHIDDPASGRPAQLLQDGLVHRPVDGPLHDIDVVEPRPQVEERLPHAALAALVALVAVTHRRHSRAPRRPVPSRVVRRALLLLAVMVLPACTDEAPEPRGPRPPPLPRSMAAIGDSITQAVNARTIGSAPRTSWATGDQPDDPVDSHYERVLSRVPAIGGKARNASVPGARMAAAAEQVRSIVADRPDYVTVLFGGNDVCTSSASNMTAVADFTAQFRIAMEQLTAAVPDTRIYVVSIPDVFRLWELFKDNGRARFVWRTFRICGALLADTTTDADRELVRQRTRELNGALRDVCDEFPRCRHDGGAVFDRAFTAEDVSPLDYFHPSVEGQAELARVSWERGYWGGP